MLFSSTTMREDEDLIEPTPFDDRNPSLYRGHDTSSTQLWAPPICITFHERSAPRSNANGQSGLRYVMAGNDSGVTQTETRQLELARVRRSKRADAMMSCLDIRRLVQPWSEPICRLNRPSLCRSLKPLIFAGAVSPSPRWEQCGDIAH